MISRTQTGYHHTLQDAPVGHAKYQFGTASSPTVHASPPPPPPASPSSSTGAIDCGVNIGTGGTCEFHWAFALNANSPTNSVCNLGDSAESESCSQTVTLTLTPDVDLDAMARQTLEYPAS